MGAGGSCCQGAEDDERMVTKMDLSHCGCTEIPSVVFQAERYVETLNMSHNRILSLPPQLFHCQELKHLNLLDNGLDSLPPAIGSLLHLVSLKLDKNCIKNLPDNLKNCRKLKRLSLSNNQLGQLPVIATQLISLEELYLNDCDLTFLPASVGRLTKLRILELRNNRLSSLPLSMNRMAALNRLDLGDNSIEIQPECISSFGSLQELLLDNNDLETFSGAGLKKLEHLDISYNNLKSLGKDIGQCVCLTLLNLGWNYLETLPESVGNLTELEGMVLEMNELSTLPKVIGKQTKLEEINVANNRLCDLPVTIGLLRNLAVLNLSRNYVQELPCEIGSCLRLSIINASYNRLQSLPAEVGYLSNLKVLDVVGNFLMYLPISMSNLSGVRAIWLSANQNVPLIPFTEDISVASGERFLTNIALPQLGETTLPTPEPENIEKTSWRRKIRFEEDEDILPGRLDRTPTPFPKELRCPAKKQQRQEDNYVNVVDGRVPVFQEASQEPASILSYSDSSVTMIREANIRSNRDMTKKETESTQTEPIETTPMGGEPIYEGRRKVSFDETAIRETAARIDDHDETDRLDKSHNGNTYGNRQEIIANSVCNGVSNLEELVNDTLNGREPSLSKSHQDMDHGHYMDNGVKSGSNLQNGHERRASLNSLQSDKGLPQEIDSLSNEIVNGDGDSSNETKRGEDSGKVYEPLCGRRQDARMSPIREEPTRGASCQSQQTRWQPIARDSPVGREKFDGQSTPTEKDIYGYNRQTRAAPSHFQGVGFIEQGLPQVTDANRGVGYLQSNPYHEQRMTTFGTPIDQQHDRMAEELESVDSFESERRRNHTEPHEMNRNNVIYSNLRNGNPYTVDPRGYPNPVYYNPPNGPIYRNDGLDGHTSLRSNGPMPDVQSNNIRVYSSQVQDHDIHNRTYGQGIPNGIRPQLFPPRVSPYGTIRQSPHLENGNLQELERPPSKQEMLSIAERNRSQNISPPCYEIAKLYSTKAALFENHHRQSQS